MSTSVDKDDPGIGVLINGSQRPIYKAVQVSGIDLSPQVMNNEDVGTWRSLVAHLNGVQKMNPIFLIKNLCKQGRIRVSIL